MDWMKEVSEKWVQGIWVRNGEMDTWHTGLDDHEVWLPMGITKYGW